jgi:hypothetical protein
MVHLETPTHPSRETGMTRDPVETLTVGAIVVAGLGGIGLATLTWLIVRDYLRGQG